MEFGIIVLAVFLAAFVAFIGLAFLAANRASTKNVTEFGAPSDKTLRQCYECLESSLLKGSSRVECASVCRMSV
ncbi:MAG: hypothetical protein HY914_16810 [Desulfomonile tiedjei]|nr:hypothetical protein [Desulfomonile tiedjei]